MHFALYRPKLKPKAKVLRDVRLIVYYYIGTFRVFSLYFLLIFNFFKFLELFRGFEAFNTKIRIF